MCSPWMARHFYLLCNVMHPVSIHYNMGFGKKIGRKTHKLMAVIPRLDRGIAVLKVAYSMFGILYFTLFSLVRKPHSYYNLIEKYVEFYKKGE